MTEEHILDEALNDEMVSFVMKIKDDGVLISNFLAKLCIALKKDSNTNKFNIKFDIPYNEKMYRGELNFRSWRPLDKPLLFKKDGKTIFK